MQAGAHTIEPSTTETLLGAEISNDLKWRIHLLTSKKSLIKQLTSRLNGLKLIASKTSRETRLMVANGIFMSKLNYLVTVWGGTEGYLLNALQVVQNKAARCVSGMSWFTPTGTLMKSCGWLSIKQLIFYNTVVMTHKIATSCTPRYLYEKLCMEHAYSTRQVTQGGVRFGEQFPGKTTMTKSSFLYGAKIDYNTVPVDLSTTRIMSTFKK